MVKVIFGVVVFALLIIAGVFFVAAADPGVAGDVAEEVKQAVAKVYKGNVSSIVGGYVEGFVNKRGIEADQITDIKEVDFEALPKEVNIQNVGDHNLAIYEVDYQEQEQQKKVFVVSYSVEELKAQGDLIIASDKRNFLNFGTPEIMLSSGFLETATGVETSSKKGYLMMRSGSITALSTNLEVIQSNSGIIEIVILKNGQPISFGNTLTADSLGIKKDYDVQSKGTVNFEPGDVISAYVVADDGLAWRDVITLIEITTID
jgi:hypothetical protein